MKKIVFATALILLSSSVFANRPLMVEMVNAEKYVDGLIKDNVVKAKDRTYYVCQTKALLKAGDDLVKEIEKSPENVKPMDPEKIMKHCEKHKHN
jgi:hypothetical protein